MARRRKTTDDIEGIDGQPVEETEGRPAHNSAARAEIIREVCEGCEEFDRQIRGIKLERKALIETRIVADLGMKKGHFAAAYKLFQMDQSERDELHDAIREVYRAQGVGFQGNWLDVADAAE